ncbi:hypothetical protein CTAYLR_004417 [Chrysophaeum taylorii]|uniref:Histidinol dehydrogenase n=1 Tax=Chrysophaeum taylorii TaxID=2483200 RepID=A0AAD7ULY4_9STRA|nr:hypothetical protein CTAYLR_004417 [Chrysophaeum taylorii]
MTVLRVVESGSVASGAVEEAVDAGAMENARKTLEEVKAEGVPAVLRLAAKFGELGEGEAAVVEAGALKAAYDSLSAPERECLDRTAARIRVFAEAQRKSLGDVTTPIPGGEAGHRVAAVKVAGCYAPGGRYPLPSSVLMTAVTARAAGVETVVVASPKPSQITLAAAHVAGATVFLAIGGAHAIAALATGVFPKIPRCDVICGPGNKWVTAAKAVCSVSAGVGIDMLAGPSEVLVIADETADPSVVAADLLAQAEHDVVARPILVAFSASRNAAAIVDSVNAELEKQLDVLPTKAVAEPAVRAGFAVACASVDEAVRVADAVAPEHLEVVCENAQAVADRCDHYGGLFVGAKAAEVLGDYGIGPNHTLPTNATSRYTGGLAVFHFLRIRTWMRIDDLKAAKPAVQDAVTLARLEAAAVLGCCMRMLKEQLGGDTCSAVTVATIPKLERAPRMTPHGNWRRWRAAALTASSWELERRVNHRNLVDLFSKDIVPEVLADELHGLEVIGRDDLRLDNALDKSVPHLVAVTFERRGNAAAAPGLGVHNFVKGGIAPGGGPYHFRQQKLERALGDNPLWRGDWRRGGGGGGHIL